MTTEHTGVRPVERAAQFRHQLLLRAARADVDDRVGEDERALRIAEVELVQVGVVEPEHEVDRGGERELLVAGARCPEQEDHGSGREAPGQEIKVRNSGRYARRRVGQFRRPEGPRGGTGEHERSGRFGRHERNGSRRFEPVAGY